MNQHPLSLVELRGFMNLYDDLWNESDNNIDPEKLIVLINNVLSLLELHPQRLSEKVVYDASLYLNGGCVPLGSRRLSIW